MRAVLLLLCLAAPLRAAAPSADFPWEARTTAETARYRLIEVSFPSPVKSWFPANDTVWGHLYLPEGRPRPCVLVLPVMAAPNVWIEMRFVHAFLRQGLAVMWIEMPYQFHRRPDPLVPSGQVFLSRTAEGLRRNFAQSVADARRAAAWLRSSGLVDADRLGLFGVSLGAMVGASAYSVDDSFQGAVFLLGGADLPGLVAESSMTSGFVRTMGLDVGRLRIAWKGLDPLDHRESNRGKRVVLVNARSDRVVPKRNALLLKEAFPDSEQHWVPFGHYGAILHLSWIPSYAAYRFAGLLYADLPRDGP